MAFPLGQPRSAVLVTSLLSFLPTISLLIGGGRVRHEEGFEAMEALFSNSQTIGMLPTLFYLQIQNTAPVFWPRTAMKKVNSNPARPSTLQKDEGTGAFLLHN